MALYKYGASDKKFQQLRGNNLVMWEAIRYSIERGCKSFCFGRTEPENAGLLQFKRGWGAEERTLRYYKYDFRKGACVSNNKRLTGVHNKLFRHMPLPLLRLTGQLLYKHVG